MVNQDTFLFHGTVEENIRLGRPEASQDELEDAARAANIHDFILGLPQGYATVIGEKGVKLSAASASAWPSPARCCAIRRSWCSTRH